jgi:hypothetical protein
MTLNLKDKGCYQNYFNLLWGLISAFRVTIFFIILNKSPEKITVLYYNKQNQVEFIPREQQVLKINQSCP